MAWSDEDLRVEVLGEFVDARAWSTDDAETYSNQMQATRREKDAKRKQEERSSRLVIGLCARCDEPRDPASKRHCEKHREENRAAATRRRGMRERMPDLRSGVTHHFTIIAKCPKLKCIAGKVGNANCSRCDGTGVREVDGYITPNVYDDGRLGEIFIRIGKVGNEEAVYEQWAVAVSTALQFGVPVDDYFRKFLGTRFEPSGRTKNPKIRLCTSVLDYVARYILMKHGSPEAAKLAEVQS